MLLHGGIKCNHCMSVFTDLTRRTSQVSVNEDLDVVYVWSSAAVRFDLLLVLWFLVRVCWYLPVVNVIQQ